MLALEPFKCENADPYATLSVSFKRVLLLVLLLMLGHEAVIKSYAVAVVAELFVIVNPLDDAIAPVVEELVPLLKVDDDKMAPQVISPLEIGYVCELIELQNMLPVVKEFVSLLNV